MKKFFIRLIQGTTQQTSSRHLTVETINRYIFTLNAVHEVEMGHISEVDLRNKIKMELERTKKYEMDKKTLRRIIENLRQENFIVTKKFKVAIEQQSRPYPLRSSRMNESEDEYSYGGEDEEPSMDEDMAYSHSVQ